MNFELHDEGDYLRADLLRRETAGETEDFLRAVREAGLKHPSARILIVNHSPQALFRVEKFNASQFLEELASRPNYKVALVARHFETRLVQQYLEALARVKHANLRSFAHEPRAIRWLTETGSPEPEAVSDMPR